MKFDSRSRFSLAVLAVALVQTNLLAQQPPPPDKPASTTADRLKRYEDAIAPYVKQARETLPSAKAKYLAGLKTGEIFYVTIRLYDEKKRFEQVFVEVNGWTGSTISGLIASDLGLVKDHKKGEKITCKQGEVYDWTISKPDGTEEGNFVGKFLDTYQP